MYQKNYYSKSDKYLDKLINDKQDEMLSNY